MQSKPEDLYERFFRTLPTMMATVGFDGRFREANSGWLLTLGYQPGELSGRPCLDIVHPEDRPLVGGHQTKMLTGEPSALFEARFVCKDGAVKWLYMRCAADPERGLFYVVSTDITPRKLTEEALRESESALRGLIANSPLPMGLQTLDGRIEYFNRTYTSAFGYTVEDTPDRKTWMEKCLPDPAYRAEIAPKFDEATASKGARIAQVSFRLTCKNGEVRDVSISGVISGGKIMTIFEDATERLRAVKALRDSEATLRHILDSAPMSMAIVGMDGTIEYINRKAVETFGYPHSDIPDMEHWWVLAYPDPVYRKEVVETWMGRVYKAFEQKTEIPGSEFRVTCKDGSTKTCFIFGVIAAGKVFVMFDDITGQVRTREALRERAQTLRSVIEQAPVAMTIATLDGKLEFANRKFTDIFGYTQEDIADLEALGRAAYPDEAYRREVGEYWLSVAAGASPGQELPPKQFRVRSKAGDFRTVISSSVITADGKIVTVNDDITARLQAEEAVKHSEKTLRQILDGAPVAIAIQNFNNGLEFINRKFTEIFGYTLEDLPTLEHWARLAYPDETYRRELLAIQPRLIETAMKTGGEMPPIEVTATCKDGTKKTINITGIVTPDRKIVSLLEDVTARRRTEGILRESEANLRRILELAPIAIMISRPDGSIEFHNRKQVETFGYTVEDAPTAEAILRLAYPDPKYREEVRARWTALVEKSIRTGREMEGSEYFIRCKNGERKTIHATGIVMPDNRVITLSEDITARQETERALRQSESLYRALIETTRTGYVVIDGRGYVVDANLEYVRMAGRRDLKEVIGRSVMEWTSPAQRERNTEAVARCARDGSILNFEVDYVSPQGRVTPVEINATVISREGVPHILTLCRDITARRRTEEELRALNQGLESRVADRTAELSAANMELTMEIAQRMNAEKAREKLQQELLQAQKMEVVGRLAGGIAHDFNNILVAISGYADLLLKTLPADSQAREDLAEILKETDRGAQLTRQLTTISRRDKPEVKLLDLNAIVAESCRMLERLIGSNIRLTTSLAPGLPEVLADPGQVSQVVMNLVVNARDAMPDGGRIEISTSAEEIAEAQEALPLRPKPGKYAALTVSDTGCGIPPETAEHIFEPFFTTKQPGKGTGLGLSIVYSVAMQAGGGIALSTAPGKGAAFKVYLPFGK